MILVSGIFGWANAFTGAVIGTSGASIAVVFIFIAGLILLLTERGKGGLEILISEKALERSRNDSRVRNNMRRYANEIRMIAADPRARPQEKVGEFHVSPRGQSVGGLRVAWHYDEGKNKLYIDDLLYHTGENDYVDKWNRKVSARRITRKDYESAGYQAFGA